MSGKRYFLDTNAIVQLLAGNKNLKNILNEADYVATSVICELEFLSLPALPNEDKELLDNLLLLIEVIDLSTDDEKLKAVIVNLRANKKLKLPDAIIAASAHIASCTLLTADDHLLKHPDLNVQRYEIH